MRQTRHAPLLIGVLSWLIVLTAPAQKFSAVERASGLPNSVDLRPAFEQWHLPMRSQGQRGTCSVFAMTGAIEFALATQRQTGTVLSVEFLNWASNQAITNFADGGFFFDLWKGYERFGICAETNFPYRKEFDSNLHPSARALLDARRMAKVHLHLNWIKPWNVHTGLTGEQFQAIKRTLARGWPV